MTMDPYLLSPVLARPIQEVTTRWICGKCGALIKTKDVPLPVCRKCGTVNQI